MTTPPLVQHIADLAEEYLRPVGTDPLISSQVRIVEKLISLTDNYTVHIDPHGELWALPGIRARFNIGLDANKAKWVTACVFLPTDEAQRTQRAWQSVLPAPSWMKLDLDVSDLDNAVIGWCAMVAHTLYYSPVSYTNITPHPITIHQADHDGVIPVIRPEEQVIVTTTDWKIVRPGSMNSHTFSHPELLARHIKNGHLQPRLIPTLQPSP